MNPQATRMGFIENWLEGKCERTLTVCQTPIPAGHYLNRWVRAFVHQPHFHSSSLVVPAHVALQADRPPMKVKFSWRPGGRLNMAFPTGPTYEVGPLEDRFKITFYTDSPKAEVTHGGSFRRWWGEMRSLIDQASK